MTREVPLVTGVEVVREGSLGGIVGRVVSIELSCLELVELLLLDVIAFALVSVRLLVLLSVRNMY